MILGAFHHAYLVNLDSRPDRLAEASSELGRVGIPFERFAARTSRDCRGQRSPGARGALLSLIGVLESARAAGHESILLLEDDLVFRPEFGEAMAQVIPSLMALEWDTFTPYDWFHRAPWPPSEAVRLKRITWNVCTHFTAIHRRAYGDLLDLLYRIDRHQTGISADVLFNGNARKLMVATTVNLVGQRANDSDTGTGWKEAESSYGSAGVNWHAPAFWQPPNPFTGLPGSSPTQPSIP